MGRCGRERGGVGLLGRLSAGLRHGSAFRKVNEFAVSYDSGLPMNILLYLIKIYFT